MNFVGRYDIHCPCGETTSLQETTLREIVGNLQWSDRAAPHITFVCSRCRTALDFDYLNREPAAMIDALPRNQVPSVCIVTTKCGESGCGRSAEIVSVSKSGTTSEKHLSDLHEYDFSKYLCAERHSLAKSGLLKPLDSQYWVPFWTCHSCNKNFVAPLAMFQQLRASLLNLSTDTEVELFACDGCNQISAYSKSGLPVPRTLDNLEGVERRVVVQRVFAIDIGCDGMPCDTPIRIYQPTGEQYDTTWIKHYLEKSGSPDHTVLCPKGYHAAHPVRVIEVNELLRA